MNNLTLPRALKQIYPNIGLEEQNFPRIILYTHFILFFILLTFKSIF